ncbi:MAG: DUF362 domain-containing protein [Nitrospinales bacterium]
MKSKIVLRKIETYDPKRVEAFVRDVVDLFSSSGKGLFQSGQKVLLKPNLLRRDPPHKCVTTHPVVVAAVCRVLRDCGVKQIDIGDSPAMGSVRHVARGAGYDPLLKRYGVRVVELSNPVPLTVEANVPHLKISGDLPAYDRIVNLPKFKSHCQMTLTLGIKNLFGCVIGKRKPALHCLVKNDKIKFGGMLVDIARHVNPCLTLVDGVQAMQGNGPTNGTPYPLGIMAGGQDMTALDRTLADIVRVPLKRVFALEAARRKKFGNYDLENIEVVGEENWQSLAVDDFRLADFELAISFNPLHLIKSVFKHLYAIGFKEKLARTDSV